MQRWSIWHPVGEKKNVLSPADFVRLPTDKEMSPSGISRDFFLIFAA